MCKEGNRIETDKNLLTEEPGLSELFSTELIALVDSISKVPTASPECPRSNWEIVGAKKERV